MDFANTNYQDFRAESTKHFGEEKGNEIFHIAEKKIEKMLTEVDDRNDAMVRIHIEKNILPLIGIYQTLLEEGLRKEDAVQFCLDLAQIAAREKRKNYRMLSQIPFGYSLFKMFCKKVMAKNYPPAGWKMEWMRYDKEEIQFNMKSCVYYETTVQYGCPELCPVFCDNDDTTLGGLAPNTIFERSGTIAKGQKVCDFHFKNGKHNRNC